MLAAVQRTVARSARSSLEFTAASSSASCMAVLCRNSHIGIVGVGSVGVSCASSLIHKASVDAISIYDLNQKLCEGEVMDLEDEAFSMGTKIACKPLQGLRDCDIIVITAGVALKPGQTRLDTLPVTGKIMHDIITGLGPLKPSTILVVVSNPVDVLANYAYKLTSHMLPQNQVIGSGTFLDTQRLRVALAQKLNTRPAAVHAYVLGEHGDSQVSPRSLVRVGGCDLDTLQFGEEQFASMSKSTASKAYRIAALKGHTNHGIGECAATIVNNILEDRKDIMVVSAYQPKYGLHMGWPCIVGRNGIERLMPLDLTSDDMALVQKSADAMAALNNILKV
jgi:L-lactate dehydrogenase